MNQALEKKLIDALEALASGESVDRILARYPEDSEELRPMLETAVQLSQLNLQPSLAAQTRSRQAFLSQAEVMRQAPGRRSRLALLRQLLLPLLSLALVLLVFGSALFLSANSAIPGDQLYSVKRLGENVRLALTADLETRAMLVELYRQERVEEIGILLATRREAQVEFEGLIESIQEEHWVIAGLRTGVNENTVIDGMAQVGRWARVAGQTQAGELRALIITVVPGDDEPAPAATAEPTVTRTIQPTASTQPTSTPEPTATATIEPSPAATSTPTLTVSPMATLTPAATATFQPTFTVPAAPAETPLPDNNDNDNDNDNGNDNGNDNNDNGNDNDNDNGNDNDNSNDNGNDNNDNGNDNDNDNGGNDSNDNDNGDNGSNNDNN